MPTLRLWILISVVLAAIPAEQVARAQTTEARAPTAATEADQLADFLVLAIKPEGEKNYQLIEIGDTKIDADRLRAAVPAPTGNLLAKLGIGGRDYDEAGEVAACRSACKANTRCHDFAYAPPNDGHPLGVCRLKAIVQSPSFGVMAPVAEDGDPEKQPQAGETAPATIAFDDKEAKGATQYSGADARSTPITLKFATPIASARVFIRAAPTTGQRAWANIEALDTKGKLIERTGAWIAPGREQDSGRTITLAGESDRIASIKIDAREPGALLLEGIEFARAQTIPPAVVENAVEEPTVAPPREEIPPPPALPPIVAERFPLPPRPVATEPPADITAPPVEVATPPVATEPPPIAADEPPEVAAPIAPPEPTVASTEPAPQPRQRGLPLWLAIGAVGVMFAGAGVYWRNHRARMLTRLTTRLVSAGFDHAKITIENVEGADVNLRFVVRAPANTNFELARKGVPA